MARDMNPMEAALRFEEGILQRLPVKEFTVGDAVRVTGCDEGKLRPALRRMHRDGLLALSKVLGQEIYCRRLNQ